MYWSDAQQLTLSFALSVYPQYSWHYFTDADVFAVHHNGNVAKSVGTLYFANTLGSAVACLIISVGVMSLLGQANTVQFAALMNMTIGAGSLLLARRTQQ